MSSQTEHWYLRKDDGSEYGPVSLDRLRQWAAECRLTPGNRVSRDRDDWIPVEHLAALEMDWMARRPDGCEYGPFTIRAVPELFQHGILPPDAELRNDRTAETVGVGEALARLRSAGPRDAGPAPTPGQDIPESSLDTTPDVRVVPPEQPRADSTAADAPVADPDAASDEATQAQPTDDELATLRAALEAREAECASLRAALDEQVSQRSREREEQVRERETLEAESTRMEAGLQATIATLQSGQTRYRQEAEKLRDELDAMAHQVSFMKKNNASLLHDLDGRARLVRRLGRAFAVAVLLVAVLLAGWIHCLLRTSHGRQAAALPDAEPVARPALPAPSSAPPASAPPAAEPPPVAPRQSARPAIVWPTIRVEGVIVKQAVNRQSLVFEEPVFRRLTELSDWGRSTLLTVARELAPQLDRFRLVVEGHTDNVPLSSTSVFESNTHLGQMRADTVAALLSESGKLPPDTLHTTSSGDRRPPYPNDSAANRRRNRTVVLHLEPLAPPQDRVAPAPVPVL